MASFKIKLGWSTPQIEGMTWRAGLFGIHRRNHAAMPDLKNRYSRVHKHFLQRTLHVSLRAGLLWALAMCAAGYFIAGYAIFHVQRSMPHNRIAYTDVILPWRWSELDKMRGQALIDQARDEIKEGKFAAGFSRLRMGLDRNPVDATMGASEFLIAAST